MRGLLVSVGLGLLCLAVVGVRGIGFEHVFPADYDGVVLAMDDAQYHARRAAYTFEHFPQVLSFDPYLNHPRGATIPWPPLYDFALGGAARLIGDDPGALDLVLAWAPVGLAFLTAWMVFGAGRALGGLPVAFGALGFYVGLPATTHYSSVGNPDHHAAVACVATLLLLAHLKSARAGDRVRDLWLWQGVLILGRTAMLLTWHGSILYVVLAESLAVAVAAAMGRREAVFAMAVGCGATTILGFLALSLPHSEVGGPWSAVEMSRLQPAAYLGFAATAGLSLLALRTLAARGATLGAAGRLGVAAGVGGLVALVLGVYAFEGLGIGWEYASRSEPYIAFNYEAQPLWSDHAAAWRLYALTLVLVPLAPLGGLLAARRSETLRGPGLYLVGWTAALLVIAVSNARYASDFAPAACLSFALLVVALFRATSVRFPKQRLALAVVTALVIPLLLSPPALELAPHVRRSWAVLQGHKVVLKRPGEGLVRAVYSFVDVVRDVTPDPGGFLDPGKKPAYGILAPPTLGFVMKNLAQRPTPAGNFGPYVGTEGLEATRKFYLASSENAALRESMPLRVRYVVTTDEGRRLPGSIRHRLHHDDGSRAGRRAALRHFRLVAESPRKGAPLGAIRGVAPAFVDTPYKLFEIVNGAVLRIEGSAPGQPVFVEVEIETGAGRRFRYEATAKAGKDGTARVRVPYATDATTPARPLGPYEVRTDSGIQHVSIRETQIAAHEEVRVR